MAATGLHACGSLAGFITLTPLALSGATRQTTYVMHPRTYLLVAYY
jgi:hypothetical protein